MEPEQHLRFLVTHRTASDPQLVLTRLRRRLQALLGDGATIDLLPTTEGNGKP